MEAGRQAFREESVCSTVWQSQPPSISIIHIHMPLQGTTPLRMTGRGGGGLEGCMGGWDGCRGGGSVCQTPVMLLFPAPAPLLHIALCVNH